MEKPEEVVGGLVEYCIALANDQIKSADFCEALLARVEPLVSAKYQTTINERLNNAIDGYLDIAKKCMQTLIDLIFNDLKPATKNLFQAPWYDGIMRQVVETMRDYMTDYQSYLNPVLLDLLVEDLTDTFLLTYLNALANSAKLKMPAAAERFKEDITEGLRFLYYIVSTCRCRCPISSPRNDSRNVGSIQRHCIPVILVICEGTWTKHRICGGFDEGKKRLRSLSCW